LSERRRRCNEKNDKQDENLITKENGHFELCLADWISIGSDRWLIENAIQTC
jgi:hypothetical protein